MRMKSKTRSFLVTATSTRDVKKAEGVAAVRSPMEKLAMRFDLSVFDLWMVILTVLSLACIYVIAGIAARLPR